MVKQTLTICQQKRTKCLSVFDHFAGLALKVLKRAGGLFFQVLTLSSIPSFEILIWGLVSKEMKKITTLSVFKVKIRIWKLENCSWQL